MPAPPLTTQKQSEKGDWGVIDDINSPSLFSARQLILQWSWTYVPGY